MEVDGGLGGVLGLVLCNRDCIRSTPLHAKEDERLWGVGSPKGRSRRRHDSGVWQLPQRKGRSDGSESSSATQGLLVT
jgi:hypothetical protein